MDALYFPKLSLPSLAWTYPNLLFFKRIRTIAPAGANLRILFDSPTRVLIDQGLVKPLDPTRYGQNEIDDELALNYLLGTMVSHRRRKQKQRLARIHTGKLLYTNFTQELIRAGLLHHCSKGPNEENDWLEGPDWAIDYLMSVVAARILEKRKDLPLITDENTAKVNMIGNRRNSITVLARRLKLVQRLLPIGPDVNLADIIAFRNRNSASLEEFRSFITALSLRSCQSETGDADFEARLRTAEQHRNELVRSVREIQTGRPAIDISIAAASFVAPILEHSTYSGIVAGIGLSYVLMRNAENYRQRRRIMGDRLIYAALAQQEFSPRNADEILR